MFGERLKGLRKSKKISQEKLGKILGVTSTAIYSWEINRTQPPFEKLIELANFFGVSMDYLLGITDEKISKIKELNRVAREAGLIKDEDMTLEEFKKAINIVNMLRDKKNG